MKIDGKKVKYYRLAKQWTQGQLAARSGVDQAVISLVENGQRTDMMASGLFSLARALGVRPDELTDEEPIHRTTTTLPPEDLPEPDQYFDLRFRNGPPSDHDMAVIMSKLAQYARERNGRRDEKE